MATTEKQVQARQNRQAAASAAPPTAEVEKQEAQLPVTPPVDQQQEQGAQAETPGPAEEVTQVQRTRSEIILDCQKLVQDSIKRLSDGFGDDYWNRLQGAEDIPLGYATQPSKVLVEFTDRLSSLVITPLAGKRQTKEEANAAFFRGHDKYREAAEMARAYGIEVVEAEGYPFGKIPEAGEAKVREMLADKMPYKGDGEVPHEEVKLTLVLSEGALTPQGRTQRANTTPRQNGGNTEGTRHDTIKDRKTNRQTSPGYEILWDAFAEGNADLLKAVLKKNADEWTRYGGDPAHIPTKFSGGQFSGSTLIRMAQADGVLDKNIQGFPLMRKWAADQTHEGKPRFTRIMPGSTDEVELTKDTWDKGKRA